MLTSPTGIPLLPAWLPKYAAALVAIAAAVQPLLPPHPTIAGQVCLGVIGVGAALGIVSQGWRSPPMGAQALLGAMPDLPLPAPSPEPMVRSGPTVADPVCTDPNCIHPK